MKILKTILISALLVFSFSSIAHASEPLNAYLFWGDGCPHCAKEKAFLSKIMADYPNVKLNTYEIYYNQSNVALMQNVAQKLDINTSGVPFLIIGDKSFVGYSEGVTDNEIKKQIIKCSESSCSDSVASIVNKANKDEAGNNETEKQITTDGTKKIIKLPILGEVNALDFSLPILTVVIGSLDGFNPCAMWVLLFLISLLLGMDNRKKMWILGLSFIAASAFVYFLFMAAWLNLILFLGLVIWVRLAIGIIALVGGSYNIKKGIKNKEGGCEVAGNEKRQVVFSKLREIVKNKSLPLALGGIILLAFAVNLVELVCSAGLPAVYTQVLALSNLNAWQYYGYILLYILFFMLDDIIIFTIAMVTLKVTGVSTKYSRYSNIIGGALMVAIGFLLIVKPEWLMFG